jgi:hypothetical protein
MAVEDSSHLQQPRTIEKIDSGPLLVHQLLNSHHPPFGSKHDSHEVHNHWSDSASSALLLLLKDLYDDTRSPETSFRFFFSCTKYGAFSLLGGFLDATLEWHYRFEPEESRQLPVEARPLLTATPCRSGQGASRD